MAKIFKTLQDLNGVTDMIVHGGRFHADDVASVALAALMKDTTINNRDFSIKRLNTLPMYNDESTLIADVGGGQFDHHQDTERSDTSRAAIGKLWVTFGKEYIGLSTKNVDRAFELVDQKLIHKLDMADIFGPSRDNDISMMIRSVNEATPNDCIDEAFIICAKSMVPFINGIIQSCIKQADNEAEVQRLAEIYNEQGYVDLSDTSYIPAASFKETAIHFVLTKNLRGEGFTVVSADAEKWPIKATENEGGCTFLHKGLFTGTFLTKEDAIAAIKNSL